MPSASTFLEKFLEAYRECRSVFDDSAWESVWSKHWSRFVLWNPPAPQVKPLFGVVADKLGLKWWDREPFRLDGALVPLDCTVTGNYPVPLLVGIEHENVVQTFKEEITKLVHIRCPLKVGITYVMATAEFPSPSVIAYWQDYLRNSIEEVSQIMDSYLREDPTTEYLYLVGVEGRLRELDWFALRYTAGSGVGVASWFAQK
jgi:hypothetical protein